MRRILLLENRDLSPHRLRMESRRSGVAFLYECASSRSEFIRLLGRQPAAVVSSVEAMPGMSLQEIAEQAYRAGIPLFLVGGDTGEERELLSGLTGLFAASYRRSRLPWLPLLLERAEGESRTHNEQLAERLAESDQRLQCAAEQMRAMQKLAVLGRLSGSIAHEINGPLESVTNLVYLLGVDEQLPPHLQGYVRLAEQELKRATEISKQTLSFCRETQTPVRVLLSALLDEVLTLYQRRLDDTRITVERRYHAEEPVLLFPGELRQVFANLVANAIEATAAGGRIVLRIHRSRRWGRGLGSEGMRVLVADSGCGIAPEARGNLGQPFFTTKGQRGTGLGLWVSHSIVKRYNGEIQLRSSTDADRHGTAFSVFLPLNLGPHMVDTSSSGGNRSQAPATTLPTQSLRLMAGSN